MWVKCDLDMYLRFKARQRVVRKDESEVKYWKERYESEHVLVCIVSSPVSVTLSVTSDLCLCCDLPSRLLLLCVKLNKEKRWPQSFI